MSLDSGNSTIELGAVSQQEPGMGLKPQQLNVNAALNYLLHLWCEREALRPIQLLLRVYPGPLWHPYQQMELLDVLRDVQSQFHGELTPDELRILTEVLDYLSTSRPESPRMATRCRHTIAQPA